MIRAVWEGTLLAESEETQLVEGAHYFPLESVHQQYFKASGSESHCPWKGFATYFNIEVDGKRLPNAAWMYREPSSVARHIKRHVAFWNELIEETA